MKKRSILIVIVVLILLFLLLRQCSWRKNGNAEVAPVAGGGQPAAKSASSADNAAAFKRVMDAPLPTVVFTPPPAPPPSPTPAPEPEPVRPRPAPAKPKVVRRPAATAPRQSEKISRPALLPPRPESPAADTGLYYVVRRKVERNGTCYLVCSIMGDASNRYFGYSVSAEQYAKAELGLVYDNKNMTGWQRVNRIE